MLFGSPGWSGGAVDRRLSHAPTWVQISLSLKAKWRPNRDPTLKLCREHSVKSAPSSGALFCALPATKAVNTVKKKKKPLPPDPAQPQPLVLQCHSSCPVDYDPAKGSGVWDVARRANAGEVDNFPYPRVSLNRILGKTMEAKMMPSIGVNGFRASPPW